MPARYRMAMIPELRVLLIRDGSLMDDDSMAVVAAMAEQRGFQVFIEKVCDDADACTVLIEDGMVIATKLGVKETVG